MIGGEVERCPHCDAELTPYVVPAAAPERSKEEAERRNQYILAAASVVAVLLVLIAVTVTARSGTEERVSGDRGASGSSMTSSRRTEPTRPGPGSSDRSSSTTTTLLTSPGTTPNAETPTQVGDPQVRRRTGREGAYRGELTGPLWTHGFIVAFDAGGRVSAARPNEREAWSFDCGSGGWLDVVPREHGGRLFFDCNLEVRAVDPSTGAVLWSQPSPKQVDWGRVSGSVVAEVDDDRLSVRDAATGGPRWSRELSHDGDIHALEADDSAVLVGDGHKLLSLDAATGNVRWTADVPVAWVTATPEGVFVRATDHTLVAIDPLSGASRWRSDQDVMGLWNGTVLGVTGGRVIVQGDWFRTLLAYDLQTGQRAWAVDNPNGDDQWAATADAGRVAFTTHAGKLHVFDAASGAPMATRSAVAARPTIDATSRRIAYIDARRDLGVEPLP